MPEASRVFRDLRFHLFTCDEAGDHCRCEANGAREFREELRLAIAKRGLARYVKMTITTCNQPGAHGPVLIVHPEGIWYDGLTVADIPRFIDEQLLEGKVLEDKRFERPITLGSFAYTRDSHGPGATRAPLATAKDLVCDMDVIIATAKHTLEHDGTTYYFCAPGCKRAFAADPGRYLPA